MSTDTRKTRTITLTDRPPVRIVEEEWPILARGDGDSYVGSDYALRHQALSRGECDEYTLRVRQHADGRTLVYGVLDGGTAWTGTQTHRGGVLLDAGARVEQAIRSVGESIGLPDSVIRECIADLPAETI